jgi:hypothetical protein
LRFVPHYLSEVARPSLVASWPTPTRAAAPPPESIGAIEAMFVFSCRRL